MDDDDEPTIEDAPALLNAHQRFLKTTMIKWKACPVSGQRLTPETTVIVNLSGAVQDVLVLSASTYDERIAPKIPEFQKQGIEVEIFDGRLLFSPYEFIALQGWQVFDKND